MVESEYEKFSKPFCKGCSQKGSERCYYVNKLFNIRKPIVEEPDWDFVSRYLFRTMIEWCVGDESELGHGSFSDIKWKFEPKVTGGSHPYVRASDQKTYFYFNLFPSLKDRDIIEDTKKWKKFSALIPIFLCMGFHIELAYHKIIKELSTPFTISPAKPNKIQIFRRIRAGRIPADWRYYEYVEDSVLFAEDAVNFRRYIRKEAEKAVYKDILPILKALWHLGCRITTKRIKIPEGPIWSYEEEEIEIEKEEEVRKPTIGKKADRDE